MTKDKITLLLVLKGRHQFTERWLRYANSHLKNYTIIIADGSKENDKYNLDKSKFENLIIENPLFPYDDTVEIFIKKIRISLEMVNTKYVLYCENDDFMIDKSITEVINFLDNNPEYVSARGEIYDFSISSLDEVYGKIISLKKFHDYQLINQDDIIERLQNFSENKHSLFHNIIRTNELRELIDLVVQKKFFDLITFQYFWNFYLPVLGKISCNKNLYMLHQNHLKMISNDDNFMRFDLSLFYNRNIFKNFFQTFSNQISNKYHISNDYAYSKFLENFSYNQLLQLIKNSNSKKKTVKQFIIQILKKNMYTNYILSKRNNKSDLNIIHDDGLIKVKNFLLQGKI